MSHRSPVRAVSRYNRLRKNRLYPFLVNALPATAVIATALLVPALNGCGGSSSERPSASVSPTPTPTPTPVVGSLVATALAGAGGRIQPTGISASGTIAGIWSSTNPAFTQTKPVEVLNGSVQFLSYKPSDATDTSTFGRAIDINTADTTLGVFQSGTDSGQYHFVLTATGEYVPLSGAYTTGITAAVDLNNSNTVLATVTDAATGFQTGRLLRFVPVPAFPSSLPPGTPRFNAVDMGSRTGFNTYSVAAVNDAENVVGTLYPTADTDPGQAYRWVSGTFNLLPPLVAGQSTRAFCINNLGVAGGGATDAMIHEQPVLWTASGVTPLPLLTNATDPSRNANRGYVISLNDSGAAVGVVIGDTIGRVAVLWRNGTVSSLAQLTGNSQGITFRDVYRITNDGKILAFGSNDTTGTSAYYLLTPTP